MRNKKLERLQELVLAASACFLVFSLGMGSAWWLTQGRMEPVPRFEALTSSSAPQTTASSSANFTVNEPGQQFAETARDVTPLPPLPPEDNPFNSLDLTEADIPQRGSGNFVIAGGSNELVGQSPAVRPQRYRVEVEEGLPFDVDESAAFIDEVLADSRSWSGQGRHQFQRVSDDSYDFRILIASPNTVDELCAPLNTLGIVSCGTAGRATLNALRWGVGVEYYGDDLENYRRYLVNHEVGHLLGYSHETCPATGAPAPVMQQQSLVAQSRCTPNPWPYP